MLDTFLSFHVFVEIKLFVIVCDTVCDSARVCDLLLYVILYVTLAEATSWSAFCTVPSKHSVQYP